jgi:hypothetical protein
VRFLATKLSQQKTDVVQKRQALLTLQKMSTRRMKEPQKEKRKIAIVVAKVDLFKAQREHGLTQRSIHELYSHSIKMIIENLRKDQSRLLAYQKAIPDLKLDRLK